MVLPILTLYSGGCGSQALPNGPPYWPSQMSDDLKAKFLSAAKKSPRLHHLLYCEDYETKVRCNDSAVALLLPTARRQASGAFSNASDRRAYVGSFFDGYLHALKDTGSVIVHDEYAATAPARGHDAGIAFHESMVKEGKQTLSLEDFKYQPMTVTGDYASGHEMSRLRPDGMDQQWWVVVRRHLSGKRLRRRCTFRGYLAPDTGRTGHMAMYDREFIPDEIVSGELEPQPSRSTGADVEGERDED
ncbi:MAG: hypothetical protein ACYS9X_01520 [Planctomycetota bacterium]